MHAVIHYPPVLLLSRTRWPHKGTLIVDVLRALFKIKRGDVVYLQRAIANKYFFAIMVAYLALTRRTMIFDFDDPVYLHSYFKTKTFCRMADVVITCTHEQARFARQFNSRVHVLHIALDMAAYEAFSKDYSLRREHCTIGWVGTAPEHYYNLSQLADVFKRLGGAIPFTFVLIGSLGERKVYDLFSDIPGCETQFIDALDWNNKESVPREIQQFDIGVLPHRRDGEWNKGKSSFKVLEYMACGVPVVSSSFGELPYIISDGVNGLLAETQEEWVEKLRSLLLDQSLRERLGRAGQARVREAYCFDAIIPRLIEVINVAKRAPSQ